MARAKWAVYAGFAMLLLLFNGLIFYTAYLESQLDPTGELLHAAFAPTCHQLASRSQCVFVSKEDGSYSFGDCMPQGELSYSRETKFDYPGKVGYKLPVCSRDVAIYLGMLLGLLALPLLQKPDSEEMPSIWILAAACAPIALDGITQLLGIRESTNALRVMTGFIVGVVLPFYILPILNALFSAALSTLFPKGKKGKK
jgi:uncharacterized membrane protein